MYIVFAILIGLGILTDMDPEINLTNCLTNLSIQRLFIALLFVSVYLYLNKRYKDRRVSFSSAVLSFFLACMIPIGMSYDLENSISVICENIVQMTKTFIIIIAFWIFFYNLLLFCLVYFRQLHMTGYLLFYWYTVFRKDQSAELL